MKDDNLTNPYLSLLGHRKLMPEQLDYSIFDHHKTLLQNLADLGNSGISVFDLYKNEHLFYSPNFGTSLGYDLATMKEKGQHFFDSRIHPDDFEELTQNGISLMKLFIEFSADEKTNFKLVNEYKIRYLNHKYVRVIEQHQNLELDKFGNCWLSMSIIDISPNQDESKGFKSLLINFRIGKILPFKSEKK